MTHKIDPALPKSADDQKLSPMQSGTLTLPLSSKREKDHGSLKKNIGKTMSIFMPKSGHSPRNRSAEQQSSKHILSNQEIELIYQIKHYKFQAEGQIIQKLLKEKQIIDNIIIDFIRNGHKNIDELSEMVQNFYVNLKQLMVNDQRFAKITDNDKEDLMDLFEKSVMTQNHG